MFAVFLNGFGTSFGALLGFFLKRGIPEIYTKAVFGVITLCVMVMGIQTAIQTQNLLLVMASLIVGTIIGTILHIEDHLQGVWEYLQKRMRSVKDANFVDGFVTLSSMQFIGAMAILGPIQAALGSNELLYFKSALDFTSGFIFGTIYGLGIVPVGIVVFLYQTLFYVLATFFLPLMTPDVIRELNAVGGVMIIGIGFNMLKVTKLKIADFLPALFLPAIYYHLFL